MSRAPRKFAAASSPVEPLGLRLDPSRAAPGPRRRRGWRSFRWSASFRSRKFSSFERFAEPRKKRAAGPFASSVARISRAMRSIAAGTDASRDSVRLAERRLLDVAQVQALREEAPVVAEPVVVDLRVQPRQEAVDDRRPAISIEMLQPMLQPGQTEGAFCRYQTRLAEAELPRRQRADRADVGGAGGPVVGERLALVRPDERAAAAVEERQLARCPRSPGRTGCSACTGCSASCRR